MYKYLTKVKQIQLKKSILFNKKKKLLFLELFFNNNNIFFFSFTNLIKNILKTLTLVKHLGIINYSIFLFSYFPILYIQILNFSKYIF